jgi:hypothetical protein
MQSSLPGEPGIDTSATVKQKQLEVELFAIEGQLRSFHQLRERLLAAGDDPSASYGRLQERRASVLRAVQDSRPAPPGDLEIAPPAGGADDSLLLVPISPPRFDPSSGAFGIGTSGIVQVGTATDDVNVVPGGPYPISGQIFQVPGAHPGEVWFSGDPHVGPEQIDPAQYSTDIDYFWIRTWTYLIPFPPPTTTSVLTYRFDGYARLSVFGGGPAYVMCFVSLGETADLTHGADVEVNIAGGWPLIADLSQPVDLFNGHYGSIRGQRTPIRRSLMVGGQRVPAVAVVVGVIAATAMMFQTQLSFPGLYGSSISIGSNSRIGRIEYSYEPQLVVHP